MQVGQYIGTRNVTAVDSTAPSASTEGFDLKVSSCTGGEVRDGLAIAALFTGGTAPYVEVIPYLYFPVPGIWVPGAKLTLYPHGGVTVDAGGLAVPEAVGGATRCHLFVVGYSGTPTSVDLYLFGTEQVRR